MTLPDFAEKTDLIALQEEIQAAWDLQGLEVTQVKERLERVERRLASCPKQAY